MIRPGLTSTGLLKYSKEYVFPFIQNHENLKDQSMTHPQDSDSPIILYDGVCNLCTESVQFVIRRDTRKQFRFASLQSSVADHYIKEEERLASMILVIGNQVYRQSTAALLTAKKLDGLWPLLSVFLLIPRPIRDVVYQWVAKHRYHVLGKQEHCWRPTPEMADRFIESEQNTVTRI